MMSDNKLGMAIIFLLIGLIAGLIIGLTTEISQDVKGNIFNNELCKRLGGQPNQAESYCGFENEQVFFSQLLKHARGLEE